MKPKGLKTILLGSLLFIICALILIFGLLSHSVVLLQASGIHSDIIILVETLPFIGLFLAFSRIIIGFNVPNMYVPIVIILTSMILGLLISLEVFILIVILAYLAKFLISRFHLHVAVKSPLIISQLVIGIILIFPFLINFTPISFTQSILAFIYGLLLISMINEKFLTFSLSSSNVLNDLKNLVKTIVFSIICFFILGGELNLYSAHFQWSWLKEVIIFYPETIIFALILTLAIGRYTGLRLSEMIRFRKLIFNK